jgi:CDP-diglyceride synthetase
MDIASVFETLMIISFGASWPLSIARSYRSRSTKGKSLFFMCFICFGYLCGITAKLMSHNYNLAFWFYFPNVIMVSTDIGLYFRNRRIERAAEGSPAA